MKQRDLKKPSYQISSEVRHENAAGYQTCVRRRAVPFSGIRRIFRTRDGARGAIPVLEWDFSGQQNFFQI
jgi:hypothetical protein